MNVLQSIRNRLVRLENTAQRTVRKGVVTSWDPEKDEVRLDFGDGDPVPAPVMALAAGDFKIRVTPKVGQAMIAFAPGGDARQMVAMCAPFTGKNASPSNHADELMIERGDTRITVTNGSIVMQATDLVIEGNVSVTGDFMASGGVFTHEGKDVGHTHRHSDVEPGPANTGVPI